MRIVELYSHLNGFEHIHYHNKEAWDHIEKIITNIDAEDCRTKVSKEKNMIGKMLYSPIELNKRFKEQLETKDWQESRTSYWVTADHRLIRKTMGLSASEQKTMIEEAGVTPIFSYNQTDFVKDRIAIEVQFGKYAFVAYDLFVKHMAFYVGDIIDVGIEIIPMKELQSKMSSGIAYCEGELYNLIRQGRGVPAVPLVMIGIAP